MTDAAKDLTILPRLAHNAHPSTRVGGGPLFPLDWVTECEFSGIRESFSRKCSE